MEKKNFFEKFEDGELDPHVEGFASGGKSNIISERVGWQGSWTSRTITSLYAKRI